MRWRRSGRFCLHSGGESVTSCSVTGRNTKKALARLSPLEHAAMQILWREGRATADGVRLALAPERELKDATVRTVLRRLEEKGYARHVEEGRAYVYSPAVKQESVAARALRQILDTFFGGNVEEMVVGMVENEVIDRAELKRLAARLERGKGS